MLVHSQGCTCQALDKAVSLSHDVSHDAEWRERTLHLPRLTQNPRIIHPPIKPPFCEPKKSISPLQLSQIYFSPFRLQQRLRNPNHSIIQHVADGQHKFLIAERRTVRPRRNRQVGYSRLQTQRRSRDIFAGRAMQEARQRQVAYHPFTLDRVVRKTQYMTRPSTSQCFNINSTIFCTANVNAQLQNHGIAARRRRYLAETLEWKYNSATCGPRKRGQDGTTSQTTACRLRQ